MITKYLRRRNPKTLGDFDNSSARIEVHANGSHTFKFKKILTKISSEAILNTEAGLRLTTELSQRLIVN